MDAQTPIKRHLVLLLVFPSTHEGCYFRYAPLSPIFAHHGQVDHSHLRMLRMLKLLDLATCCASSRGRTRRVEESVDLCGYGEPSFGKFPTAQLPPTSVGRSTEKLLKLPGTTSGSSHPPSLFIHECQKSKDDRASERA